MAAVHGGKAMFVGLKCAAIVGVGVAICSLTVQMKEGVAELDLSENRDSVGAYMTPELLCSHINIDFKGCIIFLVECILHAFHVSLESKAKVN